jgi:RNA-directed DNA polymerase
VPALVRQQHGERRPETFAFLGLTRCCGWTWNRRFIVKHERRGKSVARELMELRHEARRPMHTPQAFVCALLVRLHQSRIARHIGG